MLLKGNYGPAGGPETLIATLARHIDPAVVRLTLVMLNRPGVPQPPVLRPEAIAIPREDLRWPGIAGALGAAARLQAIAERRGVALLHTHDMRADLVAFLLHRKRRACWIAHIHGWLGETHAGRWRFYERLDRWLIRYAELVLVGSSAAEAEVRLAGAARVEVLRNAVEIPSEAPAGGDGVRGELGLDGATTLVGMVGRIHPAKGQRVLLEALAMLRSEGADVAGVVLGEGPELPRLRQRACQLGLGSRVAFLGFRADAAPYLAAMDVFVAPSLKESLPLSVLEAMARRKAVIASRVGDLPAVIRSGENGILVPPGDPAALAAALRELIADPDRRAAMARRSRETIIERYSADAMARRLEQLYLDVLEGRGKDGCRNR